MRRRVEVACVSTAVLGFDAPVARNGERHDFQLSRAYASQLEDDVKRHLNYRQVDRLEPVVQAHTIGGLVMADAGMAAAS